METLEINDLRISGHVIEPSELEVDPIQQPNGHDSIPSEGMTFEQATVMCPFLGKLALISPDAARRQYEKMEIGDKIQIERQQPQQTEPHISKPTAASVKETERPIVKYSKTPDILEQPQATPSHQEVIIKSVEQQASDNIQPAHSAIGPPEITSTVHIDEHVSITAEGELLKTTEEVNNRVVFESAYDTPHSETVGPPVASSIIHEPTTRPDITIQPMRVQSTPVANEFVNPKLDLLSDINPLTTSVFKQDAREQFDVDTMFSELMAANLMPSPTETSEPPMISEEASETFDELMILLSEENARDVGQVEEADILTEVETPDITTMSDEQIELAIDQLILGLRTEQSDEHIAQSDEPADIFASFASSVEERAAITEPSSLEAIVEQAEDQPVEDTLMQLIISLPEAVASLAPITENTEPTSEMMSLTEDAHTSESIDVVDNTITYEILDALSVLEVALSVVEAELTNEEVPALELTPLIAEKILTLLDTLGYEDPQQALLEMAQTHGVAYTLQSFQHAASTATELITRDDYREIMKATGSAGASGSDVRQIHARIGQALIWLVHKFNRDEPVLASIPTLASAIV